MCSMLSGSQAMMAAGMTSGMPSTATGMGGMGMGMGTGATGMNSSGMTSQNGMSPAAAFWQARQMAANNTHASVAANQYNPHHGMGTNHQTQHDAKMAEKIVSELQYLMTKTAAMHLQGRGGELGAHHQGGLGGMGGGGGSGTNGSLNGGLSGGSGSGRGGAGEVKPHQCQQCLKAFSSNHQLVQHIRVHTGEKPYKCSYCDRRFKQLSHVQQHTRLHTGERPYKCHVIDCGRAFIQLSNLQQHLRNHESQIERLKNRPFHCNICGKGFATESSLRTHNGKHTALVGGPNPACCPLCQKLCVSGESLMEHMKYVHKDPNASGVPAKRRNANHPCPVCGKFYVNEGSLRKHLACHPEMANQLSSSLRMWPCTVCTAVFTHENGLLAHMDQMRMDPKHQFAAQYVLTRAANERREREALLAAGLMNMSHFAMTAGAGLPGLGGSPSGHSDSSTRISTPAESKFGMSGSGGGLTSDSEMKSGVGNGSGNNPRSPLSLAHHHHAAANAAFYERAMMGSHAAVSAGLGVGSSSGTATAANSSNTNGDVNGGLRISTANNENGLNNDQQLLSPVHEQQQAAAVAHQQALAAAVSAQHHQHPHQQQQQVAQQVRSSEQRRFLYQQQQQQQMRLDGNHHYHPHRSSSESFNRGGSMEDNSTFLNHHRHQSNSNSDNSTTHETSNEIPFLTKNESSSNDQLNRSSNSKTESNVTDSQLQTSYSRDNQTQNLDHSSHHTPKKQTDQNSDTQVSENNSDEEDEEDENEGQFSQERNVAPTNSNYPLPMASTNSNYENMPYNYSTSAGANELLNRYCLEQTIRNLHEFQDVRNLSTSASSMSAVSQSMNMPSHTQNT